MHLSTNKRIAAMVFYSLITFLLLQLLLVHILKITQSLYSRILIGGVISICLDEIW